MTIGFDIFRFQSYPFHVMIALEVDNMITTEYVDILDRSELLGKMIIQSEEILTYNKAKKELYEDETASQLIKEFNKMKDLYEEALRFGSYHPDFHDIMKNIRKAKRKMDLNEKVAAFKVAERNLQRLLDDVSEVIAKQVSDQIKVPKEGDLFSDSGCSGGCGSG